MEKLKLLIKEGSAKFYEEIEVDEENDIKYFKVPPHNGLSEADRMYDFKMVTKSNIILLVHIMFRSFHDQIKILGSSWEEKGLVEVAFHAEIRNSKFEFLITIFFKRTKSRHT